MKSHTELIQLEAEKKNRIIQLKFDSNLRRHLSKKCGFEAVKQKSPIKQFDNQKYIYIIFCLVSRSSMESKECQE
jgi:hypothetical protein